MLGPPFQREEREEREDWGKRGKKRLGRESGVIVWSTHVGHSHMSNVVHSSKSISAFVKSMSAFVKSMSTFVKSMSAFFKINKFIARLIYSASLRKYHQPFHKIPLQSCLAQESNFTHSVSLALG